MRRLTPEKGNSKPSKEGKEKKKRKESSLSPILEERRKSKKRIMRLVEESFSSSRVKDEVSIVGVDTAITLAA